MSQPTNCQICQKPLGVSEILRNLTWHTACGEANHMGNCNPKNPPCQVCKSQLSDGEFNLGRDWHFDCEKCQICNEPMPNPERIRKCLDSHIPVSHITCHQTAAIEQLRTERIPVTNDMLDAMNVAILTMRHTWEPPTADITLLFEHLKKIQEYAASVSWLLKLTRDKIKIDDIAKYEVVTKERKKAKAAEAAIEQVDEIRSAERAAMLAAERENPALRDRRKAIEGTLRAMPWMSREQVEAMLDQQTPKGDKVQ